MLLQEIFRVYLIYEMDYGMDWWNGLMEWNIS